MKDNIYCIATFHSTNYALDFEKKLKAEGIDVKLMPVPRQVSSSCGTAAEYPCELRERIRLICEAEGIELDSFHEIEKKENKGLLMKLLKR